MDRARESFAEGDYRWVVEVVNHVVFADPDNEPARLLQADALEQLGYQSRVGTVAGLLSERRDGAAFERDRLEGTGGQRPGVGHRRLDDARSCCWTSSVSDSTDHGRRTSRLEVELVVADRGDERWSFGVRNGVLHARRGARTAASVGVITSIRGLRVLRHGVRDLRRTDRSRRLCGDRRRDGVFGVSWSDWTCSSSVLRSSFPDSSTPPSVH